MKLITKTGKYLFVFDEVSQQLRDSDSHADSDSDDEAQVVSSAKLVELETSINKYYGDLCKVLDELPIFFTVYINRELFIVLHDMIDALCKRARESVFVEIWKKAIEIRRLVKVLGTPACEVFI